MEARTESSVCPKCGYDRNPANAFRCEICAQPLRPAGVPLAVWAVVVAILLVLGGSYYFWKRQSSFAAFGEDEPYGLVSSTASPPTSKDAEGLEFVRTFAEVPTVPRGLFNYGGSTTFAPLRSPNVLQAIVKAHPGFRLRYTEPLSGKPGSGTGIAMLISGQISLAQSSRPLKREELQSAKDRGIALEQIPVATDGVAFFVNPSLPLSGLNTAQLRDIYTGKLVNWQQLGGPNLPIAPISRDLKAGGTVDFVFSDIFGKKKPGKNVEIVRDTTEAIRKVATLRGAIGFATVAEVYNQRSIKLLGLAGPGGRNFELPLGQDLGIVNNQAFQYKTYPATRRLFVIVRRDGTLDEQAGVAYANLLLSDQGQQLIRQAGFVSLR
ncbi:PstS family phosphate ABC transporter substrate-binding protein [Gloeobacter kilaueensis]|uniref:Phosphate binding protein n=1 Tax=Gloeobacter kilaueensis (strain ATCC BAA-2537 / CCAP 1431/1 / ULC 316 / JS1) TaxID=1183438 RepID=U5QLZ9_GLOK1|nr:PstS family phosphate ABC transporter substrate-binding protein [Gloeobacter kilaueensis]AGY59936.1 phosphate binding protein [Gloeobacter kilaueensis JS1]